MGCAKQYFINLGQEQKNSLDSLEKQSNIKWQKLGTGWNGEQSYF